MFSCLDINIFYIRKKNYKDIHIRNRSEIWYLCYSEGFIFWICLIYISLEIWFSNWCSPKKIPVTSSFHPSLLPKGELRLRILTNFFPEDFVNFFVCHSISKECRILFTYFVIFKLSELIWKILPTCKFRLRRMNINVKSALIQNCYFFIEKIILFIVGRFSQEAFGLQGNNKL